MQFQISESLHIMGMIVNNRKINKNSKTKVVDSLDFFIRWVVLLFTKRYVDRV